LCTQRFDSHTKSTCARLTPGTETETRRASRHSDYITLEQLQQASGAIRDAGFAAHGGVDRGFCSEDHVLECLAKEFGVPYIRLESRLFDPKAVDLFPRDVIEKQTVLPLFKVRDVLTVAVSEPSNVFLLDQLRDLAGCRVQIALASAKDIRRMVQTYVPNTRVFVIDDIIDDASGNAVELIEQSIQDIGSDVDIACLSPIIRLVNYIIYNAVKEGASDIHIEPTERQLRIRYRVDGALYKSLEPPVHLAPAVSSRIKIMANLDISERRLPQDGRIHVMMEGRPIDLRISTMPMTFGEKVVIRVLDNTVIRTQILAWLGPARKFKHNSRHRPESRLVTGPTGSGKTTTLYAAAQRRQHHREEHLHGRDPIRFSSR
jgi:type IV pilus assembly protein PilB